MDAVCNWHTHIVTATTTKKRFNYHHYHHRKRDDEEKKNHKVWNFHISSFFCYHMQSIQNFLFINIFDLCFMWFFSPLVRSSSSSSYICHLGKIHIIEKYANLPGQSCVFFISHLFIHSFIHIWHLNSSSSSSS